MENREHSEIMRAIGRLEGKVDGILDEAKKTNGRITRLEEKSIEYQTFIESIKTKIALVSAGISLVGFIVWEWVKNKFFI